MSSDLTVNLTVGAPPVEKDYVVSGQVRRADGSGPVAQATVRAFDVEQSAEIELGKTQTDGDGHYRIEYRSKEVDGPDLRVRAFRDDGTRLVESPLFPNVKPDLVVDLLVEEPAEGDFLVKGEVRGADGTLLVGMTVREEDLGGLEPKYVTFSATL